MSFATVTAGNPTLATDINQYANALNGTTAGAISLLGASSTSQPFAANLPSAPVANQTVAAVGVTADTTPRAGFYIASTGFGGMQLGNGGASLAAHIRGIAGGARVDENWTVGGALSVVGSSSFAGITNSGTFSSDAGAFTSDGSGHVSAASLATSAGVTVGSGLTVTAGGLLVSAGGITVTASGVTINGGALSVPASNTSQVLLAPSTGVAFRNNQGTGVFGLVSFIGTGPGTYTHGINTTPAFVGVTPNQLNSSQTVGVDTIGFPTVHVDMPNSWPFVALAMK